MPNDVKLQEGHPVDENLRPIKVGGKSTAIETAQHGNGARVSGDLEVTGDAYFTGTTFASASIDEMYSGSVPAYAGMILGYTRIANDSTTNGHQSISPDATMTVLQTGLGTDISVTFIAPPSGNVEISMTCLVYASSRTIIFALSDILLLMR